MAIDLFLGNREKNCPPTNTEERWETSLLRYTFVSIRKETALLHTLQSALEEWVRTCKAHFGELQ